MSDIQISFEYAVNHLCILDLSKDCSYTYLDKRTRKAFYWYSLGFCNGEKG